MNIFFDLDGVLRNLYWKSGEPDNYYDGVTGYKSFVDYINKNKDLLVDAPETEYLKVVLESRIEELNILSIQPAGWIKYTDKWIKEHIREKNKDLKVNVMYLFDFADKVEILNRVYKGVFVLVEDFPDLSCYDNVWLIDRKYNQDVKSSVRIKGAEELKKWLEYVI